MNLQLDMQKDLNASNGLEIMANAGNGTFIDLEENDIIDFKAILGGEKLKAQILKGPRIVVKNLNAAFCLDGSIDTDSDSDGLCDKDEGSISQYFQETLQGKVLNPINRNSLDPQYSDKFMFQFSLIPQNPISQCPNLDSDEDIDLLNPCEERLLKDLNANGPTKAWTEALLARGGVANPKNPDSSGNGFLDGLQFFQFGTPSSAVNYLNLRDRYASGVSGEYLMIEHRHPKRPDLFGPNNYDAKTTFKEKLPSGENCYSFNQTQLALYPTLNFTHDSNSSRPYNLSHGEGENIILIYFISVPEDNPNGSGTLHYSFQRHSMSNEFRLQQLNFNNFQKYEIPWNF